MLQNKKECPQGKILNPKTNRCVKVDGKVGKAIAQAKNDSVKSSRSSKSYGSSTQNSKNNSTNIYMVVQYFNYRKEQYFKVLSTFFDKEAAYQEAERYAREFFANPKNRRYAWKPWNIDQIKNMIEDQNEWLELPDRLILYTVNSGYDEHVVAVVKAPSPVPH